MKTIMRAVASVKGQHLEEDSNRGAVKRKSGCDKMCSGRRKNDVAGKEDERHN